MNNQKVWFWSTSNIKNDGWDLPLNFPNAVDYREFHELEVLGHDQTEEEKQRYSVLLDKTIELTNMVRTDFLPIPKENMPNMMYAKHKMKKGIVPPEIFYNHYWMSHKKFVDILQQFRLGKTQISEPMRFFDLTKNDYVNDTEYYFINIAERHQYFLPEQRVNPIFPNPGSQRNGIDIYYPPFKSDEINSDNFPISTEALNCPVDIWHDPNIRDSLFLSDRLAQALMKSGIDENLLVLWECALVEPN